MTAQNYGKRLDKTTILFMNPSAKCNIHGIREKNLHKATAVPVYLGTAALGIEINMFQHVTEGTASSPQRL